MKRTISLLLAILLLTALFSGCIGIVLPPINQPSDIGAAEPAKTEPAKTDPAPPATEPVKTEPATTLPPETEPPKTEAPTEKPTEPVVYTDVCGYYKLKGMNGMTLREYFEEQFAEYLDPELGLDFETMMALSGLSLDSLEEMMTITLNEDGTAVVALQQDEEGETAEGVWEQQGNKILITVEGDPLEFTYENGQLLVDMDGQEMIFAR